jgi:hypothetical protein
LRGLTGAILSQPEEENIVIADLGAAVAVSEDPSGTAADHAVIAPVNADPDSPTVNVSKPADLLEGDLRISTPVRGGR